MPGKKRNPLLLRFLIWRTKHLTQQQFVMLLSAVIGFTAGLGAVIIKNLTHYIQHLLEGKFIINYHDAFYFLFPIAGLAITLLIIKYVLKHPIGHGIPSTLYAISK